MELTDLRSEKKNGERTNIVLPKIHDIDPIFNNETEKIREIGNVICTIYEVFKKYE